MLFTPGVKSITDFHALAESLAKTHLFRLRRLHGVEFCDVLVLPVGPTGQENREQS